MCDYIYIAKETKTEMEVNIACMILRTIVGVFSLACGISSAVIFYPDQQPVYIQMGSLLELKCQGGKAGIMKTFLLVISYICSIGGSLYNDGRTL